MFDVTAPRRDPSNEFYRGFRIGSKGAIESGSTAGAWMLWGGSGLLLVVVCIVPHRIGHWLAMFDVGFFVGAFMSQGAAFIGSDNWVRRVQTNAEDIQESPLP